MDATTIAKLEGRLLGPAAPGRFDPAELEGLPEPVRRHLTQAIAPGTPFHTSARLRMRGSIRVGRWLPFRAHQVLSPHQGFVWSAWAAGVIAGTDRYADGAGAMAWRLAGLVTVAAGEGPDVSRSAAGRAGAEGIWLPTALLPRFGVRWSAVADDHVTAAFEVGETPLELHLRLDGPGRIASLAFDRWGDPDGDGRFGRHTFGGQITGYGGFGGLTIPSAGRLGWRWGGDGWDRGEFFRYRITALEPSGSRRRPAAVGGWRRPRGSAGPRHLHGMPDQPSSTRRRDGGPAGPVSLPPCPSIVWRCGRPGTPTSPTSAAGAARSPGSCWPGWRPAGWS